MIYTLAVLTWDPAVFKNTSDFHILIVTTHFMSSVITVNYLKKDHTVTFSIVLYFTFF